jgi:D-alanyl-D-alanine carboxypeptidase
MRTLKELGIPATFATQSKIPMQIESDTLVSIGLDMLQREQRMEPRAAAQWQVMVAAAAQDGVILAPVSAFRSFDYQRCIIERKLAAGQSHDKIFRVSAVPGFSEHHTGRAIDIGTPGYSELTEDFETTPAFAWLTRRAGEFGFSLSYPRDNPLGIVYEPWHWLYQ